MKPGDFLQRVLFEQINARCVLVRLDEVIGQVLEDADYPPAVRELLAQSLLVVALLSSGIKFNGRISLQLQSSRSLPLLMADCTEDGGLRAIARMDEQTLDVPDDPARLFAALVEDGILTLTLEPADGGQRWQGIVPLEGKGLDQAIEAYFERSEQLPTRLRLAVADGKASALMLQQMPGQGEDEDEDKDGWNRLLHLLATVKPSEMLELDAETLFYRLFHEESRRLFPPRPLKFFCPCTRERVLGVLQGLGAGELESLAEEEEVVEVRCQFCNRAYHFDQFDLNAIIQSGDEGSQTVH
jgi:molecular chaperone Hsp33